MIAEYKTKKACLIVFKRKSLYFYLFIFLKNTKTFSFKLWKEFTKQKKNTEINIYIFRH